MTHTDTGRAHVRVERFCRIAVLRMTRPETRNSLDAAMREALLQAIGALNDDPAIDAMVLAGSGRAFCAGGDLNTMMRMTPEQAEGRIRAAHALPRCIHNSAKPIVAAVEGACAGAGLGLAAVCDLLVAGTAARFVTAFEKVGLMPDVGAAWSVTARIGPQAARRLFLLGGTLDASKAHEMGLVDTLAPEGRAEAEAVDLAERLARTAPGTRRCVREIFREPPASLEDALRFEAAHQPTLYLSADLHEGIAAFREKRDPVWRDA
ncbi:enoyl-CoA hydratase/carnithine racemase [Palleronia aestuarii]|uniref:Enoyl-CoA hydratase/carnithine racemase n=1 Tax=Palleronia aestuarii TaxID=568105 RepID=A0A2W7N4U9_9RHOB|nr:enoyl-CoA hydratase/isomerase family protein [Palleronia aestuarii]PZX15101.1 enoyl-CoA hydratase/carnithine racemase [Palleronia aestuarii]